MHTEIALLRRRRQNLKHQIAGYEARFAVTTAKLRAVEQELLALDPDINLAPQEMTHNPFFERRELVQLTLDVLREAGMPLRRSELVKLILAAKCHGERPKGIFEFVHHRVPTVLLALKNRRLVERNGGWVLTK
jgi:hypothetical protein